MSDTTALSLVLASASPRRAELLRAVGVEFTVQVANIVEARALHESAFDYVQRLAHEKAAAVRLRQAPEDSQSRVILAADTIVVRDTPSSSLPVEEQPKPRVSTVHTNNLRDGEVLEKPIDYADAERMWVSLSDSEHTVMTAVCVNAPALQSDYESETVVVQSRVLMGTITRAAMQRYWASGEPRDKAGAYALQGRASAWVQSVTGSSSNIIGLPMYEANQLLRPYGLNWL